MSAGAWVKPRPRHNGPPFYSKNQVVTILDQLGTLLELKGANGFRVRAYQNASRLLQQNPEDLWTKVQAGTLGEMKGIGKGLEGAITEAMTEGDWGELGSLYDEVPAGLIEMLGIPNLGPKRIKQLNDELAINSVTSLKVACEGGQVAPLRGFGAKSQARIIEGIELLSRFRSRRRLDIGLLYGEAVEQRLAAIDGISRVQLAGSARRRRETIGDLDLVAAVLPEDHERVSNAILSLPGIADVKGAGESKISLILKASLFDEGYSLAPLDGAVFDAIGGEAYEAMEAAGTIDAQVRLVEPRVFPYTLAYFTGSKEHNIRMRQRALDQGLKLNEFGLIPLNLIEDGDMGMIAAKHSLPAVDEADIHAHLGMAYVPPEMREDTGEVERAEAAASGGEPMPTLLSRSDVRGALHNHTVLSDGAATLEQMAEAAMELGWTWLGISDHSQSLVVANGAQPDDLLAQGEAIRALNEQWADAGTDFRLFHGTESDIHVQGRLDYDDETLSHLSHVIGSVHALAQWRPRTEEENTEDLVTVVEHPSFTVLGHPTGRILQGRDGFEVDLPTVLRRMGELNAEGELKAVELNASPYRLDLDWRLLRYARDQGVPVLINPDAHSTQGLRDMHFGVEVARKGWIGPEDVLNTLSGAEMAARLGVD